MATTWVVRKRDGTVLADIAGISHGKHVMRRLNRPASFTLPRALVHGQRDPGRRVSAPVLGPPADLGRARLRPWLFFHGLVWTIEDEGDEDMVYSQVTCYDPMMLWRYRPARDDVDSYSGDAGNLSDPSFIAAQQVRRADHGGDPRCLREAHELGSHPGVPKGSSGSTSRSRPSPVEAQISRALRPTGR